MSCICGDFVVCVSSVMYGSVFVTADFGAEDDENQSEGICLCGWVCGRLVCKAFCHVV